MLENPIKMQYYHDYVVGTFSQGSIPFGRSMEAAREEVVIHNFRKIYFPTFDRLRKTPIIVVSAFVLVMGLATIVVRYTQLDIATVYTVAFIAWLLLPLYPMSKKVKKELRTSLINDPTTGYIIATEGHKAFVAEQTYLKEQMVAYEEKLQTLTEAKFQARVLESLEKKVFGDL